MKVGQWGCGSKAKSVKLLQTMCFLMFIIEMDFLDGWVVYGGRPKNLVVQPN